MPRSSLRLPSSAFWCTSIWCRTARAARRAPSRRASTRRAGPGTRTPRRNGPGTRGRPCSRDGSRRPRCASCRGGGRSGAPRRRRRVAERVRAPRRVRPGRVELGDEPRQQVAVVAVAPGAALRAPPASPSRRSPSVLVVPVPDDQRRVRAEPGDRLAGLRLDLDGQPLLLGVGGAGEEEVLPDEHARLVAGVVEVVRLVDAAAPDPQQVHVRLGGVGHAAPVAVAVDLGDERVVGDPVRPAHLHDALVHEHHEGRASRPASCRRAPCGNRPAMSRRRRRGVASGAPPPPPSSPARGHADAVQRLVAVSERPPSRASGTTSPSTASAVPARRRRSLGHAVAPGRGDLDGDVVLDGRPRPLERDAGVERLPSCRSCRSPGAPVHADERTHRGDPHARPPVEPDRPPDAAAGDVDAPVPAERAGLLAQRVVRVVVDVGQGTVLGDPGLGLGDGGREGDVSAFSPLDQRLPRRRRGSCGAGSRSGRRRGRSARPRRRCRALGDEVVAVGPVVVPVNVVEKRQRCRRSTAAPTRCRRRTGRRSGRRPAGRCAPGPARSPGLVGRPRRRAPDRSRPRRSSRRAGGRRPWCPFASRDLRPLRQAA